MDKRKSLREGSLWIKIGLFFLITILIITGYGGLCSSNQEGTETNTGSSVPLNVPSNLAVNVTSSSQIDISWTIGSRDYIDGFRIERKTGANGTYADIIAVGVDTTSYSDTNVTEGQIYYYRIRAYNVDGNFPYSIEVSVSTFVAPASLIATVFSSNRIDLQWTDTSNSEGGFKIERKVGETVTYTEIATVGANVISYSNTSLVEGTIYYYRIRAYNAETNSPYSNEAQGTTLLKSPTGLATNVVSSSQVNLSWTDTSNYESGFKIERSITTTTGFTQIDTVGTNVVSYSNTGLIDGTVYYYRVRAYNVVANSAYSAEASATTTLNAPTILVANAISSSQINLSWTDNSGAESGFKIERSLTTTTGFTQIDTVGANITSYSDSNVAEETAYYYRVKVYNATGNSPYSNEVSATTVSPPSFLTAAVISPTRIDLQWTDNSNYESGFKIESRQGGTGAYTQIATVGANVVSYSNSSLIDGTLYYYRIRAYNVTANSTYSNEANATTPFIPPSGLTANALISSSQVNLSWTDNSGAESGFKIERSITTSTGFTQINTVGTNITSYSNTNLTEETPYYYQVRAYNATGNSDYSNEASATTPQINSPTGLTSTAVSSLQVNLSWIDNSAKETGFKIERSLTAGSGFVQIDTVGANITYYPDANLTDGISYYYRVRTYNLTSDSTYSNETNIATPLNSPTGLTALTVSSSQVNLSWTNNSANDSGFRIERSLTSGSGFTEIGIVGTNVTSYSSINLTDGTVYYYRVKAYNVVANSSYSNEANATTLLNSPGGLVVTAVSSSQVNLSWADNSVIESGFRIERSLTPGSGFIQIDTVGANITSYPNTGLSEETPYYYRVRAYNGTGNSDYSNEASATTSLNPPSGLTATGVSSSQVNLSWADNSGTETGFKIERSITTTTGFTQIDTVGANVISYADTSSGLIEENTYYYRIRAYNDRGDSAYSNETSVIVPFLWITVGSGFNHTIGRSARGALRAWGYNLYGQLGSGNTTNSNRPTLIGSDTNWAVAVGGEFHTIAIKSNTTIWAWGRNNYGQLGSGNTTNSSTPIQIGSGTTDWDVVACGGSHTVVRRTNGTLLSCGYNTYGQLGLGNLTNTNILTQIGANTDWAAVACGTSHTIARRTDGTLWAWGYNNYGQLGFGNTTNSSSPIQIGSDVDWAGVSCGASYTVALKTNGTLWAWGRNNYGQFGVGNTTNSSSPIQIGSATDWAAVACGDSHTIARRTDGTLWAWGYNAYGQLGRGNTTNSTTPVQIGSATDWTGLACGAYHSSALKINGTLWSWGRNNYGQLGVGDLVNRTSPAQVRR